jgi:hypothetical protein
MSVPRKDVASVWTRGFPISKEPASPGQCLKKKRFLAGIRQLAAASGGGGGSNCWSFTGNSGTDFVGKSDNQTLELRVNSRRSAGVFA